MLLPVSFTGDTGKATAAAGTPIKAMIPPRRGCKARVSNFRYTPGTTAHVLTAMRPLARTTALAAAAAAQAVVVLKIDPGTLMAPARPVAINDWLVFEGPTPQTGYYTFVLAQVAAVAAGAVAGSLSVTLTANVPVGGIAAGAICWLLGTVSDPHPQYGLPASATANLGDVAVGLVGARGLYEPLLLWIDNVTAAGVLENATVAYTAEARQITTNLRGAARPEGEGAGGQQEEETDELGQVNLIPVLALPEEEIRATRQALIDTALSEDGMKEYGHLLPKESHYLDDANAGMSVGQYHADPESGEEWARQVYGPGAWEGAGEEGGEQPQPSGGGGGPADEGQQGQAGRQVAAHPPGGR